MLLADCCCRGQRVPPAPIDIAEGSIGEGIGEGCHSHTPTGCPRDLNSRAGSDRYSFLTADPYRHAGVQLHAV